MITSRFALAMVVGLGAMSHDLGALSQETTAAEPPARPNIVIIFADDLDYITRK
jgi:hypothetical protein